MTVTAHVYTHHHSSYQQITFERIRLIIPGRGGWREGRCLFDASNPIGIDCRDLSEITADGAAFPVLIGDGVEQHSLEYFEGLNTCFPAGADAFLWREAPNGFWTGLTIASAFGRLRLVPYECDPT